MTCQEETHGHGLEAVQERLPWSIKADPCPPLTQLGWGSPAFMLACSCLSGKVWGPQMGSDSMAKGPGQELLPSDRHRSFHQWYRGCYWYCTYSTHGSQILRPPRTAQPCWKLMSHEHHTGELWMVTECKSESKQRRCNLYLSNLRLWKVSHWAVRSMKGHFVLFTDASPAPRRIPDTQ